MSSTAAVEFENVIKDYPAGWLGRPTLRAVAGVSFAIMPGEVFGLLGPNRAGKTTLVKLLLTLCRPTSGQVRRFGRPASDYRTLARVGYIHENHAFPRYLTAAGLLETYGALALVPYSDLQRRIPQLLERVGLADRSREPIARFSKGMVQRLGVAQAIINEPDLLVLDEPNEGLDLPGRHMVGSILKERRQQGRSALLVSHVLAEVEQFCDRVGVVRGGKVVFLGSLPELRARSGDSQSVAEALQKLYREPGARDDKVTR